MVDWPKRDPDSIHQYYRDKLQSINDCQFRFIVIRDPIKRFLSAYSNRVIHYGELSKTYCDRHSVDLEGLPFTPDLATFIDNLQAYRDKVESICSHTMCLGQFVQKRFDTDLARVLETVNVYRIEDIRELQKDLSNFLGSQVVFPHLQTGGPKFRLENLSEQQVSQLTSFYHQDYQLIEKYYRV